MKKLHIKNKKSFLVMIIFLVVLCVFVVMIRNNNKNDLNNNDENNNQEMISGEEKSQDVGCAIPGWSSIIIPKNTKIVNVNFYNPIENKDLYYLTFELRLDNGSNTEYEVLYKSEMLEPGQELQQVELSRELEAGEYDVIVHVQPYKMDSERTPTNNANMKAKLVVK